MWLHFKKCLFVRPSLVHARSYTSYKYVQEYYLRGSGSNYAIAGVTETHSFYQYLEKKAKYICFISHINNL